MTAEQTAPSPARPAPAEPRKGSPWEWATGSASLSIRAILIA
jgi:hypothetical protein